MCKEKYINPFTDFGFKRLFGTIANKASLIKILNAIIGESDRIADISYIPTEHLGIGRGDRYAIFDIYCLTDSGNHIIIEMQNMYQRFFKDRSVYYSTFPIQEAAKKGKWDFRLPKVYTVSFLNFVMDEFKDEPTPRKVIKLADIATGEVFYDGLTYIYIELPKFQKSLDEINSPMDYWLFALKHMDQFDDIPQKLRGEMFDDFFRSAEVQAFTPIERREYEESLKVLRDNYNVLQTAKEDSFAEGEAKGRAEGEAKGRAEGEAKGRAEGEAKGRAEERAQIAAKLIASGMTKEQAAAIIGIPVEDI